MDTTNRFYLLAPIKGEDAATHLSGARPGVLCRNYASFKIVGVVPAGLADCEAWTDGNRAAQAIAEEAQA
jgi:hypothetical protein